MNAENVVNMTLARLRIWADRLGSMRAAADAVAGTRNDLNPRMVYRFAMRVYANMTCANLDRIIDGLDRLDAAAAAGKVKAA